MTNLMIERNTTSPTSREQLGDQNNMLQSTDIARGVHVGEDGLGTGDQNNVLTLQVACTSARMVLALVTKITCCRLLTLQVMCASASMTLTSTNGHGSKQTRRFRPFVRVSAPRDRCTDAIFKT